MHDKQTMKILITGVAGFIGSNLAEKLIGEGYEVTGIDNLSYGVKDQIPKGVELYEKDIRLKDIYPLFKGIDFVFHLAAKNCIEDCQKDPVETADINVRGTVNVFEAAKEAGVKKVIYAESSAIYEGSDLLPTPETENRPESFYARSKAAAHLFAGGYQKFHRLTTTALRYFSVYGPRQDYRRTIPPIMSAFIIKLLKSEAPIIYGDGTKKRDFVYVDDVNDFHVQCLKDERTDNKVFNIGSGESYSVRDIYNIVSEALNMRIQPIHKENLTGEAQETLADISKARELGWNTKTSIQKGLTEMVDYIKKEIKKGNIQ